MSGRSELVAFIASEANSPMACVGAAVSYMKTHTKHGPRIAEKIDEAIRGELEAIKLEQAIQTFKPANG